MRRRDDAHVDFLARRRADALERSLLQHAQQLGLQVERQIADFVEKQRPAMRQLESPLAGRDGARERAAGVAEELALDQRRRQGGAVDDHERVGPAGSVRVDGARKQLLARPGFAQKQHRAGRRGDLLHASQRRAQREAGADDAVELGNRRLVVGGFLLLLDARREPFELGAALAQRRVLPAPLQRAAEQRREHTEPLQQGWRPRVRGADGLERERAHQLAGDLDREHDRRSQRRPAQILQHRRRQGLRRQIGGNALQHQCVAIRTQSLPQPRRLVDVDGDLSGSERRVGPEQHLDHVAVLAVLDERGAIDADRFADALQRRRDRGLELGELDMG